eukprot:15362730-Alexandrium_andersonii.AAC.1
MRKVTRPHRLSGAAGATSALGSHPCATARAAWLVNRKLQNESVARPSIASCLPWGWAVRSRTLSWLVRPLRRGVANLDRRPVGA